MPQEPNVSNAFEQAISRALRDNLERVQHTSDELHQSIGDIVAACSSSKPTNALPPMLRAQTAAASLSAALDVLSRFLSIALQPGQRSPFEAEIARLASTLAAPVREAEPRPPRPAPAVTEAPPPPGVAEPEAEEEQYELTPASPELAKVFAEDIAPPAVEPAFEEEFDVNRLSAEEQELHRRANRVAKVSMQDIKMLRPEQVRQGRQNKDICIRLKDDIEKAHREYDRRFKPIMDHPVDYFYRWLVEILAEGDPHALGEYPYATTARQR
jgi:hypothetical protein